MRIIGTMLVLSLATVSAANAQNPAIVGRLDLDLNLKRLQGTWIPEFLVTDKGLEAYPLKGRSLIVSQNGFARFDGGKNVQSGTIALFPGDGASIDFIINDRLEWDFESATHTPDKLLRRHKALFKIDGDLLTIAYPVPGRNRPDDLKAGPHRQVVVYKHPIEKIEGAKDPEGGPKVDPPVGPTLPPMPIPVPQVQPMLPDGKLPLPIVGPPRAIKKKNKGENP